MNVQNVGSFLGSLVRRKDKNEFQNASGVQVSEAGSNSEDLSEPGFPKIGTADFPDKPPMINGLSPIVVKKRFLIKLFLHFIFLTL